MVKQFRMVFFQTFLLNDIIENLEGLPDKINAVFNQAITYLLSISFALGVLLIIVGAAQWATGWDNRGGKKTIVKGVFLIILSLVAGGVGFSVNIFV
jgi:hypothetical protein